MSVTTWLIFAWFALACIGTHNKRIWQAKARGELPEGDREPPACLGWLAVPQYAILGYDAYLNWQQALSVFVITFLLAVFASIIMETIGAILLIPVALATSASRKAKE